MSPKIKVCGITRTADALLAKSLGAVAVGFIFARSLRQVSSEQAAAIISELPSDLLTVGVFADPEFETLLQTIQDTKIKAVQLHGKESPQFISELKARCPELVVYKMIGIGLEGFELDPHAYKNCDFLLFDSTAPREDSGERPLLMWQTLKGIELAQPFFVAGGLNAENVGEVISGLKPYGVDISSGVEILPGFKSVTKMKSFFQAVGESHV